MAIDFNTTFGARRQATAQRNAANADLVKAQIWINIGYMAGEGDDAKFVSLPAGIPLDTMERVNTRSSNNDFAQFQAARNALLDQMIEAASKLEPGEAHVMEVDGGLLAIQIRRVNDQQAEPATDETNPYARRLFGQAA